MDGWLSRRFVSIMLRLPKQNMGRHLRNSPTKAIAAPPDDRWRTDNAGRLLTNALRRFEDRVMALMAAAGHEQTRGWHVNLTRHLDLDGTRITELARRAQMTNAAMTELIDQCEAIGLVQRSVDPTDKRARLVGFTPQGEQWLADFGRAVAQAQQEMADEVGGPGLDAALAVLRRYGDGPTAG